MLHSSNSDSWPGGGIHSHPSQKRDGWALGSLVGWLEVLVVADGHAGWGFDWLGGDEFCRVAFEVVDAVDEGGAVDGLGGVGGRGSRREFLENVVDVGAGDGAGLS